MHSTVQRNGIICFFYVDDIVFAFNKIQANEVKKIVASVSQALTIEEKVELKWFLGLHVICNCKLRTLWLSQKAYIQNICNDLAHTSESTRPPTTPMDVAELLPLSDDKIIIDFSRTLYQRKMGSLLFAAIATHLDIAFAALRLSMFN